MYFIREKERISRQDLNVRANAVTRRQRSLEKRKAFNVKRRLVFVKYFVASFLYQQSHHRVPIKRSHFLNVHNARSIKPITLIHYKTHTNLDTNRARHRQATITKRVFQKWLVAMDEKFFLRTRWDFNDLRVRRSLILADFDDLGPGKRTNLSSTRRTGPL